VADFDNFWHATLWRNLAYVNSYNFARLVLMLLLHYLVKCRDMVYFLI